MNTCRWPTTWNAKAGLRPRTWSLGLGLAMLLTTLGCAEAPRGPVERVVKKPCSRAAGSVMLSTDSVFPAFAVIAACALGAQALDHPTRSAADEQARTCPPLDAQALVPARSGDYPLNLTITTVTVSPIAAQAVHVNLGSAHPRGCWLQTGIETAVLERALASAVQARTSALPASAEGLVLVAELVTQEESEAIHGPGNITRKARIAMRYTLTRPPSTAPLWSELITTEMGANYGLFARNAIKTRSGEDLLATAARVAYERAIRENLYNLVERLRSASIAPIAAGANTAGE